VCLSACFSGVLHKVGSVAMTTSYACGMMLKRVRGSSACSCDANLASWRWQKVEWLTSRTDVIHHHRKLDLRRWRIGYACACSERNTKGFENFSEPPRHYLRVAGYCECLTMPPLPGPEPSRIHGLLRNTPLFHECLCGRLLAVTNLQHPFSAMMQL
jgi:hypothetical protein